MTEGNTGMNALVGGAVAVVFAFLPFSTVLGGAIAGYLQKGEIRDGVLVGALAGGIAFLPMFAIGWIFGGLLFLGGPMMGMPGGMAALGGVFFAFAFSFAAIYFVGFGAVGGALGAYIVRETDVEI